MNLVRLPYHEGEPGIFSHMGEVQGFHILLCARICCFYKFCLLSVKVHHPSKVVVGSLYEEFPFVEKPLQSVCSVPIIECLHRLFAVFVRL